MFVSRFAPYYTPSGSGWAKSRVGSSKLVLGGYFCEFSARMTELSS
jgi:hypothetical protein